MTLEQGAARALPLRGLQVDRADDLVVDQLLVALVSQADDLLVHVLIVLAQRGRRAERRPIGG